jgi:hypothetical protein
MAWDSNRPVPWRRLARDWLLYVGIMCLVFVVIYRDRLTAGIFAGLLVSGPIFLAIGALMAKFGYQRSTLRAIREQARAARTSSPSPTSSSATRPKPAATRRTGGGTNRPGTKARGR